MSEPIVATGSIGFDSIETPAGRRERILGGSAVHFSLAAAIFDRVALVGAVGDDFPDSLFDLLRGRGVSVSGVERIQGTRTFAWHGRYGAGLEHAETLGREVNAAAQRSPALGPHVEGASWLFLANDEPGFQLEARESAGPQVLVGLDTRENWVRERPAELREAMARADVVFINEAELALLAPGAGSIRAAARDLLGLGPSIVTVKRGSAGATAVTHDVEVEVPVHPVDVVDTTGAGDSFAGGFVGALTGSDGIPGADRLVDAMCAGAATASVTVEAFGTEEIVTTGAEEIAERAARVRQGASVSGA